MDYIREKKGEASVLVLLLLFFDIPLKDVKKSKNCYMI